MLNTLYEEAKAHYQAEMKGQSVSTKIGEVHFTGKTWEKMRMGLKSDSIKALLIPKVKDILTKGEYLSKEELTKERKDFIRFHFFLLRDIEVGDKIVDAGVTVGESKDGRFEFTAYGLGHSMDKFWNKRVREKLTRVTDPRDNPQLDSIISQDDANVNIYVFNIRDKDATSQAPKGYIRSLIPAYGDTNIPSVILLKKSLAVETVNTEQVGEVLVFRKNGYYYGHFTDYGFSLKAGEVKNKDLSAVVKAIESFKKSSAESFKDDIAKAPKPFKKVIPKATVTALKKLSRNLHSRLSPKDSDKALMNIAKGIATFADGETTIVSKSKFDIPDINGMPILELRRVSDEMYVMEDGAISDGEANLATELVFDMANTNITPDIEIPITADVLKTLQYSINAVDYNNPKLELKGLLIDVEDGKGKAVATDTKRLTISKEFKVKGKDGQYIILPNHITKDTKSIEIDSSTTRTKSETDELTIYSGGIHGRYPDYQRIIPQYPKNKITFNGKELAKILESRIEVIMLVVTGIEMAIYNTRVGEVEVGGKKLSYTTAWEEIGVIKINPTHNNTDERIALQSKYLLDAIEGEDEVVLEYNEPNTPLKITTKDGEVTIVMPIVMESKEEVIESKKAYDKKIAEQKAKYEAERREKHAKDEAEQREQEAKEREEDGIAYDFLKSLSPQREASARKLLNKLVRADGEVIPYKEFVPMRVKQGYTPHKKEWKEWSRKLDRNIEKSSWVLSKDNSFTTVTKTEADFAQYLIDNVVKLDSIINSIETEDKHIKIGDFQIVIESQKGTMRSGTDEDGKDWSNKMHDDYGYFVDTFGNDGDEIDVFVSSDADIKEIPSKPVFYLKQNHQDGVFDEDKFILGTGSQAEAEKVYYRNYDSGYKNSGSWHTLEFGELKKLLKKLSRIYTKRLRE